jgi:hypothetical protein
VQKRRQRPVAIGWRVQDDDRRLAHRRASLREVGG